MGTDFGTRWSLKKLTYSSAMVFIGGFINGSRDNTSAGLVLPDGTYTAATEKPTAYKG